MQIWEKVYLKHMKTMQKLSSAKVCTNMHIPSSSLLSELKISKTFIVLPVFFINWLSISQPMKKGARQMWSSLIEREPKGQE